MKVCAIVGHKGTRFRFKYKDTNNGCKRLKRRMETQFILLYEKGVRQFWIAGGLGVDIWAGEILLRLKEKPEYSEIQLKTALPYVKFSEKWDDRSKCRMNFLVNHSTETKVVCTGNYSPAVCYRQKNRFLVEQADCLLAVYDNDRTIQNEVGAAVFLAEKKNIPVVLIHPDTGIVTQEQ